MGSMRNRFGVPDVKSEPLPKRPEAQKAPCLPGACLERQLPSNAHCTAGSVWFSRLESSRNSFSLLDLQDKDCSQCHDKGCKCKDKAIAQGSLPIDTGYADDQATQYGCNDSR